MAVPSFAPEASSFPSLEYETQVIVFLWPLKVNVGWARTRDTVSEKTIAAKRALSMICPILRSKHTTQLRTQGVRVDAASRSRVDERHPHRSSGGLDCNSPATPADCPTRARRASSRQVFSPS